MFMTMHLWPIYSSHHECMFLQLLHVSAAVLNAIRHGSKTGTWAHARTTIGYQSSSPVTCQDPFPECPNLLSIPAPGIVIPSPIGYRSRLGLREARGS
ncbi:uncharacterized protein CLUP02_14771 [Colletotrichum lupini]|uniref:Uncharacterized protein n=1 Tax=Colletotrichum lupini TaxID=145971 RepID=A0A9Q8WND6_9PEZI|nr:uncharacterized protein CLUP02_14771 [Colletotrichum lupini]UQC89242.1 hypothetical protein CLUP02_14771 [Colletotrichum lupini]